VLILLDPLVSSIATVPSPTSSPPAFESSPGSYPATPSPTAPSPTITSFHVPIDPALVDQPLTATVTTPVESDPDEHCPFVSADQLAHGGCCQVEDCPGLRTLRWGANKWRIYCPDCNTRLTKKVIQTTRVSSSGRQSKVSEKVLYEVETEQSRKRKADDELSRREKAAKSQRQDQVVEDDLAEVWAMEQGDIDD
jgi:hypothetical protein